MQEEPSSLTWFYCAALSFLSLGGASCSIIYGVYNITLQQGLQNSGTGLCGMFSLFTGGMLCILTVIWSAGALSFKSLLTKFRMTLEKQEMPSAEENNNNFAPVYSKDVQAQQKSWVKKRNTELRRIKKILWSLRLLILFSMLFSLLTELCSTGIFWYTAGKLSRGFAVADNCFCSTSEDASREIVNVLKPSCPQKFEDQPVHCLSVFMPEEIILNNRTSYTLGCQKLSGVGSQESKCQIFILFWMWFKILRILLPLLILLQLPIILVNCYISLVKPAPKGEERGSQDHSWFNLENLVGGVKVDPIHFYENICAPIQENPPFEERLGPYGQEQDKIADPRSCAIVLLSSSPRRRENGPIMVKCPTVPSLHLLRDSPPDKVENTFSTPVVHNCRRDISPNFNVSHLGLGRITPIRTKPLSASVNDTSDQADRSRLSSFGLSRQPNLLSLMPNPVDLPPPPPLDQVYEDVDEFLPPPPCKGKDEFLPHPLCKGKDEFLPPPPCKGKDEFVPPPLCKGKDEFLPPPPPKGDEFSPRPPSKGDDELFPPPPSNEVVSHYLTLPLPTFNSRPRRSASSSFIYQVQQLKTPEFSPPPPLDDLLSPPPPLNDMLQVESTNNSKCKKWSSSPMPDKIRLSGSRLARALLNQADMKEVSKRARNISTSSTVDWAKLP